MEKLRITKVDNNVYEIKDTNEKKYIINMDFFDIDDKPEIGDYIYMNRELLNPKYDGYSTFYTFGDLKSRYGKENISKDDIDVIKLVKANREFFLKRLYG